MRLVAEGLSATRGEDLIFQDISFEIAGGEALVVKGPNGSGKSTLLRVLAGLLPAESGTAKLLAAPHPVERLGEACHYLGHRNAMKRELTVDENLTFWKAFFGDETGRSSLLIPEIISAISFFASPFENAIYPPNQPVFLSLSSANLRFISSSCSEGDDSP